MTSQECLTHIKGLEIAMKGEFDGAGLESIWPRLLRCDVRALSRACKSVINKHKRLPPVEVLASMVEDQERRFQELARPEVKPVGPELNREMCRLMRDRLSGMDTETFRRRLFELADRFQAPAIARRAMELR